jgi:hypothetical protein
MKARHLAGSMCASPSTERWPGPSGTSQPWHRLRPSPTRHHPARPPGLGGQAQRRPQGDGRLACFEALIAAPEREGGQIGGGGYGQLPRDGLSDDAYPRGRHPAGRRRGVSSKEIRMQLYHRGKAPPSLGPRPQRHRVVRHEAARIPVSERSITGMGLPCAERERRPPGTVGRRRPVTAAVRAKTLGH